VGRTLSLTNFLAWQEEPSINERGPSAQSTEFMKISPPRFLAGCCHSSP